MQIIAIGHKARQGKTTTAHFIAGSLKGRGLIWGISDGIKVVARATEGMGIEHDKPLLQKVGLAYREDDPLVWLKAWEGTIVDQGPIDWVIVPDMRFRNEATFFRQKGALLIKVTRIVHGVPFIAEDRPADHPSEVDLDYWDEWDMDIRAGTLIQLKARIAVAMLTNAEHLLQPVPQHGNWPGKIEAADASAPQSD